MTSITHTSFYNITCKVCVFVRDVVKSFFVKVIEMGEVAGRARAARQLADMGLYEEAKQLMLRKDLKDE